VLKKIAEEYFNKTLNHATMSIWLAKISLDEHRSVGG